MEYVTISGRISGIYTNRLGYKTLDVGFYSLLEPLDFVVDSLAGKLILKIPPVYLEGKPHRSKGPGSCNGQD